MKRRGRGARRSLQVLGAVVLTLCSGAAIALGLGDIRVLSRPGQPLLAEIPVISNEPGELDGARVALASTATFARVGLERPARLVDDLQFSFAKDIHGRAVIRVSSQLPVQQETVNFLVEVDWGNGRLVREYVALVDAPGATSALAEPTIQAPQAAAPRDAVARAPVTSASAQSPRAAEAQAVPRAASKPAAAPPVVIAPGENLAPVKRGQTLSHIAVQLARGNGHSLDQTMLALLRANPDAFIGGNINRLKQGAVLRTPLQDELTQLDAAEARAIVREQVAQWRQARAPIPQPAEAGATPRTATAPPPTGARLEIAPAVSTDGNRAGTTTGTAGGGEGDRLVNEQLQQAREDIASRDAEIQELRTRVAELEKLKQQQESLIALKDGDLAAAQQHLQQTHPEHASSGLPIWLWGGLVLLLAAGAGWWASRRRKPSPFADVAAAFEFERAIDPIPVAPVAPRLEPSVGMHDSDPVAEIEAASPHERAAASRAAAAERAPPGESQAAERSPRSDFAAPTIDAAELPRWAASQSSTAARDRLQLAVAYLDLDDLENARSLLLEVAAGDDPDVRAEAVALLDKIDCRQGLATAVTADRGSFDRCPGPM